VKRGEQLGRLAGCAGDHDRYIVSAAGPTGIKRDLHRTRRVGELAHTAFFEPAYLTCMCVLKTQLTLAEWDRSARTLRLDTSGGAAVTRRNYPKSTMDVFVSEPGSAPQTIQKERGVPGPECDQKAPRVSALLVISPTYTSRRTCR